MSSLSDIRQHLASVTQTRQITNAMYLLSVSRLKKALLGVDHNKEYMTGLRSVMDDILFVTQGTDIHNRFFVKENEGTALFLSVMGDKGLCGDYNTAVAQLTAEEMKKHDAPKLYCFGMVGKEKLRAKGLEADRVLPGSSMHPSTELAREVASALTEMYLTKEVNEVYIVYTPYSKGERKPVCFRLLPLLREDFTDVWDNKEPTELLFEPSAEEALAHFVPLYCSGLIYGILSQSAASENAARMEAMQSASSNADEMTEKLLAEMNAVRQLNITNEITEIAAAAELNGV